MSTKTTAAPRALAVASAHERAWAAGIDFLSEALRPPEDQASYAHKILREQGADAARLYIVTHWNGGERLDAGGENTKAKLGDLLAFVDTVVSMIDAGDEEGALAVTAGRMMAEANPTPLALGRFVHHHHGLGLIWDRLRRARGGSRRLGAAFGLGASSTAPAGAPIPPPDSAAEARSKLEQTVETLVSGGMARPRAMALARKGHPDLFSRAFREER